MTQTLKLFAASILSLTIAVLTLTGHVQSIIHFAAPENEMFFFILVSLLGAGFMFAALSSEYKPKSIR